MATYNGHNEDSSGNLLLSIGNGMTATVETGSTASQAYTKGAYLFFQNKLCKANSAISSGATLTIGSNLSQTTLGAELTSHLRASDGKEFYFDIKNGEYGYYPSASKISSEFVPFGGTGSYTLLSNDFQNSSDSPYTCTLTLPNKGSSGYVLISMNRYNGSTLSSSITSTGTVSVTNIRTGSIQDRGTSHARQYDYYSISNISAGDTLTITCTYSSGSTALFSKMIWCVYS